MEEGGNCRCGRFIEVVGGRIWKEKEEWSSLSVSTTDIYLSIVTPIRHYTITPFTLKDVGLEIYKRGKNFKPSIIVFFPAKYEKKLIESCRK